LSDNFNLEKEAAMSKEKRTLSILGLAAPLAMSLALMSGNASAQLAEKWWTEGYDKTGWVNSAGECWYGEDGTAAPNCSDCSKRDTDGDGVNDCNDKCPDTKKGVKVNKDGCEIIADVVLSAEVLFGFNQANLTPAGKAALDDVAARVKATPGEETLEIVGYTDPFGSDSYNQGLSQRRANAVSSYLAGKGIKSSSLKASGRGETNLVVSNCSTKKSPESVKCNAPNRRVEIKSQ
jgi:OOP family OmpA-OmpF porin